MNKRIHLILSLMILAGATIIFFTGCTAVFDRIADTVLANEVRFDDREAPRTAFAITASADGVQLVGGQGHGLSCSLPLGAQTLAFLRKSNQAPIALQMRQACAFHDYCYRHGNATYGYSQADCDFMLQQQAFRLCAFINRTASISECETNARKVTLGVRLGGFGNFKRARALDDQKASTYFEFDPYPVRANAFRVVRIADAPRQWVRDGVFPKAAYHFDIRSSGSLVHVLGWKSTGAVVCASFELPGSYGDINAPPMVVREASGGEDWFVWWKRGELASTGGHFALLPPGRALQRDWVEAAGGFAPHEQRGQCDSAPLWNSDLNALNAPTSAFVTGHVDLNFSEVHPAYDPSIPGMIRLLGLSTYSCSKADASLCLVDVVFDTAQRQFRKEPASPTLYRAVDHNCSRVEADNLAPDTCDGYRNHVGGPIVVPSENAPSLIWTRRGAGSGDGYEDNATVRRYAIGKSRQDPAVDLGELTLTSFYEAMEPALLINAASGKPVFVSLVASKDGFKLLAKTATQKGKQSQATTLNCFRNPSASWLRRPPALVQDRQNANQSYIVFSRVRLNNIESKEFTPFAALEVAVATLKNGVCTGVREASYNSIFERFIAEDERAAALAIAEEPSDRHMVEAMESFGRFAERVRGGQMVLADITGDGVPDLIQVVKMPKTLRFRTAVLRGSIDASGLHFQEFFGSKS